MTAQEKARAAIERGVRVSNIIRAHVGEAGDASKISNNQLMDMFTDADDLEMAFWLRYIASLNPRGKHHEDTDGFGGRTQRKEEGAFAWANAR